MASFSTILLQRLKSLECTQVALSNHVGLSRMYISDVVKGRRWPPMGKLAEFADFLELEGKEREDFLIAGALLHTHELIQRLVFETHPHLAFPIPVAGQAARRRQPKRKAAPAKASRPRQSKT